MSQYVAGMPRRTYTYGKTTNHVKTVHS
jgi:hypothetical protein